MPPYLFTHTYVNVGTMKNTGFEFDITFNAVQTRDFTYTMNFIGTTQSNKFVDFSNSEFVGNDYYDVAYTENPYPNIPLQRIEKGRSIGSFYMFKYAGINTDGEWLIYDKDGDIIKGIQGSEADRQYVGNGLPKFTLSTSHNFRYKNFDLSLFFRGAFGFDIFNIHDFYYGTRNFPGNMLCKAYQKNEKISSKQNPIVSDYFLNAVIISNSIRSRSATRFPRPRHDSWISSEFTEQSAMCSPSQNIVAWIPQISRLMVLHRVLTAVVDIIPPRVSS